jgi:hypothetical protein
VSNPTAGGYIGFMFRPFFRAWWASLTGFASVLALYLARDSRIEIGGAAIASITLLFFSLVFVILSVVTQGWELYQSRTGGLRVKSVEKSKEVTEGWILILETSATLSVGAVVDIHKRSGVTEVPLALVQITGRNSDGAYQATPIGKINPAHIREHSAGGLRPTDLVVRPFVEFQRFREVRHDFD